MEFIISFWTHIDDSAHLKIRRITLNLPRPSSASIVFFVNDSVVLRRGERRSNCEYNSRRDRSLNSAASADRSIWIFGNQQPKNVIPVVIRISICTALYAHRYVCWGECYYRCFYSNLIHFCLGWIANRPFAWWCVLAIPLNIIIISIVILCRISIFNFGSAIYIIDCPLYFPFRIPFHIISSRKQRLSAFAVALFRIAVCVLFLPFVRSNKHLYPYWIH